MAYFEDIGKQKELKVVLDSWLNTPFRHHCGIKGKGCDCIHFVAKVFEEMGVLVINKNTISNYPKDWHIHNTRELLSIGIEKNINVKKVDLSELKNGDIILSHYGKAASHAAIYFDGYVYQSLTKIGVRRINFKDKKFKKIMRFAYRVL